MYTYQDFENEVNSSGTAEAINQAINYHIGTDFYKTAKSADEYDHQRNELITNYVKMIFTLTGIPVRDFTASNNKICSNFFHKLNVQRCNYLLGNGVSFTKHVSKETNEDGVEVNIDETKEALGNSFDTQLKKIGYDALIHGVSFGFWNVDKLYVFSVTEFVPLYDEDDGSLRAGIRFWRIDDNKPTIAVLYEQDGFTKFKSKSNTGYDFEETQAKKAYKTIVRYSEEGGEEVVGEENYIRIPIVPLWGSSLKQSTLIGMKEKIDSFDLIRSGFANDLTDCAEIYWIVENCGGMSDADLDKFRDRLKINHIANVDSEGGGRATPYTQEIPFQARKTYLDDIRAGIYEDFGALDVHTIAAGATNDHIDAAYQPMDDEADDFEYQIIEFIQNLLSLLGIEDDPIFKRNRISNQAEQTNMVLTAANYLDDETILNKLPFISVDEVESILEKKALESEDRFEASELEGADQMGLEEYGNDIIGMLEELL